MAIYKLEEIIRIHSGKNIESKTRGNVPVVGSGGKFSMTNNKLVSGPTFTLPRKGTMKIIWYDTDIWNVDTAFAVSSINDDIIDIKFLYYLLISNQNLWFKLINGSTRPATRISDWRKLEVPLPNLEDQKKIIDIIEPIEHLENNIKNAFSICKQIMRNNYIFNTNETVPLSSILNLINSKYEGQKKYFATNSVSEFSINADKLQVLNDKVPSRANVSPKCKSFILSKLDGENKIHYFIEKPKEVYSTGFFNFETRFVDHLSSFFMTENFKEQKNSLATGTTMRAINNKTLESIYLKKPEDESSELTTLVVNLDKLLNKVKKIKNKMINILIK